MRQAIKHCACDKPSRRSTEDQHNDADRSAGDLDGPRSLGADLLHKLSGLLSNRGESLINDSHRASLDREEHGRSHSCRHSGPGADVACANVGQSVQYPASQRPGIGRCCQDRLSHMAGAFPSWSRETGSASRTEPVSFAERVLTRKARWMCLPLRRRTSSPTAADLGVPSAWRCAMTPTSRSRSGGSASAARTRARR